jgi:FtsP/CotA-like multicopper oxidase with cupredoxin domain
MPAHLTRRRCLQTVFGLGGSMALGACAHRPLRQTYDYELTLEPRMLSLLPGTQTPAWTFNGEFPGTTLRLRQNQPVRILVRNHLPEPTTIHWHGIRLNNAADGVPGLTQEPIPPGGTFVYEFTCPDAGTFWYHPHYNSLQQLSRGLVGLLIVEEESPPAFDQDLSLVLKDWHLNPDGSFAPFTSHRAAARNGTLGSHATINGKAAERLTLAAGSVVRLRVANLDNTRVFNIGADLPAQVVAVEGNPLAEPRPLHSHPLGAGMRVDLAIEVPREPGIYHVLDRKGQFAFSLCELEVFAADLPARPLPTLPLNPIPALDLANAIRIPLIFEWAGALSPVGADGKTDPVFWTVNKRAWADHNHHHLPEPLATLRLGQTYIFELYNASQHFHPIHLHGFTFTVLKSNQRDLAPYHTDTLLLEKNERAEVAIVADNPGDWMFHCHVIEHMETGLMGYIRVT